MTVAAPRRVLVVEDEWIIADIIVAALEDAGFVVVGPVGWIAQATVLVEDEQIDAALIDINLNGERSYGLAAQLASEAIPFAFLSGYSEVELPPGLEGRPLMQKPVDEAALRLCVDRLVEGEGLERACPVQDDGAAAVSQSRPAPPQAVASSE